MSDDLSPQEIASLTARADISAPPPGDLPVALVLFGTNQQAAPVWIAASRYQAGSAPLIIATGGVNRHDGTTEGREFAQRLADVRVPATAIRVEDRSKDTWQNVELAMPYLLEAQAAGLPLAAVSKWHHTRAVFCLRTQLPGAVPLYAISWEPAYNGQVVTRESWPGIPDGRRRVLRETEEVTRQVADGTYAAAVKRDGAWW